jgi:uncharacterized protein YpbB
MDKNVSLFADGVTLESLTDAREVVREVVTDVNERIVFDITFMLKEFFQVDVESDDEIEAQLNDMNIPELRKVQTMLDQIIYNWENSGKAVMDN